MPNWLKRIADFRSKQNDTKISAEGLDRSKGWMAIFVSSVIVLLVFSDILSGKFQNVTHMYIVACCSIGIIVGCLFTIASYIQRLKTKIYGNAVEASVSVIIIALWSVAIGILQSPKNNLASTVLDSSTLPGSDSILNANLYFASWFLLAAAAMVLVSIFKELGLSKHVSWLSATENINRWFFLLVSSLIVLVSASLLEDRTSRTIFAVSVGLIASVLPFLVICSTFFKYKIGIIVQWSISLLCVALYSVEVVLITSPKGPGHSVSNLYFSSWISFILSISLFMNILDEYIAESGINTAGDETCEESQQKQTTTSQDEPQNENSESQSGADVLRL